MFGKYLLSIYWFARCRSKLQKFLQACQTECISKQQGKHAIIVQDRVSCLGMMSLTPREKPLSLIPGMQWFTHCEISCSQWRVRGVPWMQKSQELNCFGGGVEQTFQLCTFSWGSWQMKSVSCSQRGFSGRQLKVSVLRCLGKQCMGWENLGWTEYPLRGEESKAGRQVAGGRDSLLCDPADPCPEARWLLSFPLLRILVSLQDLCFCPCFRSFPTPPPPC